MKGITVSQRKINRILMTFIVACVFISLSTVSTFASTLSPSVFVSGSTSVGQGLTATTSGISADITVTYQWMHSSGSSYVNISGATASSYTLTTSDVGYTLKVVVTLSDSSVIESAPTGVVTTDEDGTSVSTAKSKIESSIFLNPSQESDYIDEAAITAYSLKLVTAAISDASVGTTIQTVSYVSAVDGTLDNPNGTAGSYEFTVYLSKGSASATTASKIIAIPAKVYTPTSYEVIDGAGQKVEEGSETAVSFTINGDIANFQSLYCNGVQVDSGNYTVSETLMITLHAAYVANLLEGAKEFTVIFSDGSATVSLTVCEIETNQETENSSTSQDVEESVDDEEEDVSLEETDEDAETSEEKEVVDTEAFDDELEFEDAEVESEDVVVVEKVDEVNSNILWYVLFIALAIVGMEIVFVKVKRNHFIDNDEEMDEDEE